MRCGARRISPLHSDLATPSSITYILNFLCVAGPYSEQPDLAVDVHVCCRGIGLDDL